MKTILDAYGTLLAEVDGWFHRCLERYPDDIACASGCSSCCRGLFDITLLDALYLQRGFAQLSESQQAVLRHAAEQRLIPLSAINPAFVSPWLLNGLPEEEWDDLMPEEDEVPCVLLTEDGRCLLYGYRPMTCRLNGIPLIDLSGEEFFDEWCTLNFMSGDPRQLSDLKFAFMDLFARELLLFQELLKGLTGTARNEVDLFIPAALVMVESSIIEAVKALES
jgi:Fe-S-cluster containining protein